MGDATVRNLIKSPIRSTDDERKIKVNFVVKELLLQWILFSLFMK